MLATLYSAAVAGLDGQLIRVEVDVANGLPGFTIVGLPDAALSEARERVRGAIRNSGFGYPARRIVVNLAPADVRKAGASFDLAMALGILAGDGEIAPRDATWAFLGELSLSGEVRPLPGVLPMVATLARAGHRRVVVPVANLAEAGLVPEVEAVGVGRLEEAARLLAPRSRRARDASAGPAVRIAPAAPDGEPGGVPARIARFEPVDLAEVRGQAFARWALETALAGEHNLLLIGPPGAGKTLLARTVPTLLPSLEPEEALEATIVASVAGLLAPGEGLRRERPLRAPHHTSS